MRIVKSLSFYVLFFLLSLLIAVSLLLISAYLPQEPVDENVLTSAIQLMGEDTYVADRSYGSIMSITSEALMFMESKAMNKSNLQSILTNPRYIWRGF